jgi:membrane protein DedA with SNARE-associated domain
MFLFWIGGVLGRRFFVERDYRFFRAQDIIRAEEWFRKYGYMLILLNRFFPGIRSAISVAGGISGLRGVRVALLALLSCAVWNLIWIVSGYALGSNWEMVKDTVGTVMVRYNLAVWVLLAIVVLFFLSRRFIRGKGEK